MVYHPPRISSQLDELPYVQPDAVAAKTRSVEFRPGTPWRKKAKGDSPYLDYSDCDEWVCPIRAHDEEGGVVFLLDVVVDCDDPDWGPAEAQRRATTLCAILNADPRSTASLRSDYREVLDFQIGVGTRESDPSSIPAPLPDAIPAADDGPHQTASTRSRMIERMMSEETAVIPPIFSQKDLLGRGWSKRLIARLLGEPDWTAENPHGAGFAAMRCWRQDRVIAAEATAAFRERS
jgi:hypothetical protein